MWRTACRLRTVQQRIGRPRVALSPLTADALQRQARKRWMGGSCQRVSSPTDNMFWKLTAGTSPKNAEGTQSKTRSTLASTVPCARHSGEGGTPLRQKTGHLRLHPHSFSTVLQHQQRRHKSKFHMQVHKITYKLVFETFLSLGIFRLIQAVNCLLYVSVVLSCCVGALRTRC